MTDKHDTPDPKVMLSNRTKWATTAAVGLGSGVAQLATRVHGEFYENLQRYDRVKELVDDHVEELNKVRIPHIKEGDALTKAGKRNNPETFIKGVRNEKQNLAKDIDAFVHSTLGIESENFFKKYTLGTIQRFRTLSDNTRMPVVFGAVTAAFIGGAGTLMFFNSMQTRNKLDQIADKHTQDHSAAR